MSNMKTSTKKTLEIRVYHAGSQFTCTRWWRWRELHKFALSLYITNLPPDASRRQTDRQLLKGSADSACHLRSSTPYTFCSYSYLWWRELHRFALCPQCANLPPDASHSVGWASRCRNVRRTFRLYASALSSLHLFIFMSIPSNSRPACLRKLRRGLCPLTAAGRPSST